ncbi:MAG TPA: (d)CMP kinase [Streptosporangiaceae bacterium]|nr:(d)CMP kinase [Streptosporangiaceae bacterium]
MTHSVTGIRPGTSGTADGRSLVIAVDGPSGSGKSSAARGVATVLGLRYLDTGAMYRAVTWWMLEHDVDLTDAVSVATHARDLTIDVSTDPAVQRVRVDGIDVTTAIRNRRVSNVVSLVAAVPQVRAVLVGQQQAIIAAAAAAGGIVAEGRDIGTVVAPGATVKVFLTASERIRAERRAAELVEAPSAAITMAEQSQRDRKDAPQSQMAADAIEIDATELGLDDVIRHIVGLVTARRADS